MTDFGHNGPYRDYIATPDVHTAMAGILSRSGLGGREPLMPPAGLDDEWCVITVRDSEDWERLCRAVGDGEMARDARYLRPEDRRAASSSIDVWLSAWTARLPPREVQTILQNAGVPAGMMLRVPELGADPHLTARHYLKVLEQPGIGTVAVENAPFIAKRIPEPDIRPAPLMGERTREVMTSLLGMSDAEVTELVERDVLEEARTE